MRADTVARIGAGAALGVIGLAAITGCVIARALTAPYGGRRFATRVHGVVAKGDRNDVKRRLKVEESKAVEQVEPAPRKNTNAVREKAVKRAHPVTCGPYMLKEYQSQQAFDEDCPAARTERPVMLWEGRTAKWTAGLA